METWTKRVKSSRKTHVCNFCYCIIPIGEKYRRFSTVWEGEWSHSKQCDCCHEYEITNQDEYDYWEEVGAYTDFDDYAEFAAEYHIEKMLGVLDE